MGESARRGAAGNAEDTGRSLPIWMRPGPARRSVLSREAIVAAAVRLADAEGLAAVSIRRVAAELDARAMSLYSHIGGKSDLLDLMSDHIAGEVLLEGGPSGGWRAAVTAIARREREVARRHPWFADLMSRSSQAMIGPNGLRHLEQSIMALAELDLAPADAWRIIAAVNDYVYGYIVREAREHGAARDGGVTLEERDALMRPYLDGLLGSGEFGAIASLLREGLPNVTDSFEDGLNWLLDGIERQYP